MNEFKRALIDVAGDMSESEKAVKNSILHKQPRKKKNYIAYYLMPVVVVALLIVAGLQFIPKVMDIRQAAQPTNVLLFEFLTVLDEQGKRTEEILRASPYYEMIRIIGIPKYAQSIGITITNAEIEKGTKNLEKLWHEIELPKVLAMANITQTQFDESIAPLIIEQAVYAGKLQEKWFNDYPKMVVAIAALYTDRKAFSYMDEHYETQLTKFKEQHKIPSYPEGKSLGVSGAVAAVEGNMFLLIENTTVNEYAQLPENYDFEDINAAWFMNDLNQPVKVGDYVDVKEVSTSVERIGTEKVSVGLHAGIELLLPSERAHEIKEIHLSEANLPTFNELFSRADFVHPTMANISRAPLYIVQLENKSYTVWQNKAEQLYMKRFGEVEVAQFTRYTSKKLLALFQQIESK